MHLIKLCLVGLLCWVANAGDRFYTFAPLDIGGNPHPFERYRDTIVLIVNVASECGYTDVNYRELQRLHEKFGPQGFEIVAFPCNQFGEQEPKGNKEIRKWVKDNYHIGFELMSKVHVKGPEAIPLFKYLKSERGGDIEWNFDGKV